MIFKIFLIKYSKGIPAGIIADPEITHFTIEEGD